MAVAYGAAAPNLALVKYWGKRDPELVLPLNDSISVTLDDALMRSVTMVTASPDYTADSVELNGRPAEVTGRMRAVLRLLRARCHRPGGLAQWPVHAASWNSFPTAAGLASSASGLCAFAVALARLYGLVGAEGEAEEEDTRRWLSSVARVGSGSACRSLFGGFARWAAGVRLDGADSVAEGLSPAGVWDLRVLVCVLASAAKAAPSTEAMERTARTSGLMPARLAALPDRLERLRRAVAERDFPALAEVAMRDSNSLHAVCADAFPPVCYLTDASRAIIDFAHGFNAGVGRVAVGYTADAGPNVCLLTEPADLPLLLGRLRAEFEVGSLVGFEGSGDGCGADGAGRRVRIESVLHCRLGRGALDIPEAEAAGWFGEVCSG